MEKENNSFEKALMDNLDNNELMDHIKENVKAVETLMAYYNCAIMEVETKFKVLNEQLSLEYDRNPIEGIKTRIKSVESIIRKLKEKNLAFSIESIENNLNDIAGIRVICAFPEDIYTMAKCLTKQDDIKLLRVKDYIKNPKANGYRSLHLIVSVPIFLKDEKKEMKVEVQLRTIAMDFWASLDHKISYKKDISEETQKELTRELLDCANQIAELDMRMQNIRTRLEENA